MSETLSERLREEAMTLAWTAWSRMDGGHECTMSASLAEEAADTIDALVEALVELIRQRDGCYSTQAAWDAARAALAKAKGGDNG